MSISVFSVLDRNDIPEEVILEKVRQKNIQDILESLSERILFRFTSFLGIKTTA